MNIKKKILCLIGLHKYRGKLNIMLGDKEGIMVSRICLNCSHERPPIKNKKEKQKRERVRYWCREREVWVTEYSLFFIKVYKLKLFGTPSKWTFEKSKNKQFKPSELNPVTYTIEQAIAAFGKNKWMWPVNYEYIGFKDYKSGL